MGTPLLLWLALAAPATTGPCEPARVDLRSVGEVSRFYGAAAAGHEGAIYVFGGETTFGLSSALHRYDVTTHAWRSLPVKGLTKRRYAGAAVLDGKLYLVGGSDGRTSLDVVERVDLATLAVEKLPPLPAPRSFAGVAAWQGALWVAGGEKPGKARAKELFVFDPAAKSWRAGPGLGTARDTRLVVLGETLFALPGYDGKGAVAVTESLTRGATAWSAVDGAPAVSGYGVAVADGRAVLFGDYEEQGTIRWFDGSSWGLAQDAMVRRRHSAVASATDAAGHELLVVAGGNRTPSSRSALSILEAFALRCRPAGEPSCGQTLALAQAASGDAAPPSWEHAIRSCGVGLGLGAKLARLHLDRGEAGLAADALVAELTAGAASKESLALAIELAKKDPAARAKLAALGRTARTAVPSHGVAAQRPWLAALGCPGGEAPASPKQFLTADNLDRWSFGCGGKQTELWFDFGALSAGGAP